MSDPFDAREVFDLIRTIRDPEHPNSLEELGVVNLKDITIDDSAGRVLVQFTPTIPHCSMVRDPPPPPRAPARTCSSLFVRCIRP